MPLRRAAGRRAAWLLLLPALLLWAGTAAHKAIDPDESQHLQAAWLVAGGAVPFADFWEHHTPVLYWVLAPLMRWLDESPAVYRAGRVVMLAGTAAALLLVGRLAGRLSAGTALGAVALLTVLPRFVEHATETRPDVPALAAGLAGLLALVRTREPGGRAGGVWMAGLWLGVAASFTPKAAAAAPGLAAAVALAERAAGPGALGRTAAGWARLAAGAGLPLLAMLAVLAAQGGGRALDGFAEHVLARQLDFADFTKEGPVTDEGLGFLALAAAGVLLVARRHGRGTLAHPLHGPLLLAAGSTAAVLALPTTPAVYRHAWLPVLAVAGVYAGHALATALAAARGGRPLARLAALVALAVGMAGPAVVSARKGAADEIAPQLRLMRRELARTCPGEPILDGTALYVFRPAAHRYRVLIGGVREWIAAGVIPEARIVEDVRASRPRVAHLDKRLQGLVGPMAEFLARHYVRAPDGLLVAGARVPATAAAAAGGAVIEVLRGETYRLAVPPAMEVTIDGRPVGAGLVRLAAGTHRVAARGGSGTIELTALDCAERRALSG